MKTSVTKLENDGGRVKVCALVLFVLFLGSILAQAGTVSVEAEEMLTFADVFGESPIDRVRMETNFSRVAFTNKRLTFLERFDDSDMAENEDWTYYETGSHISSAYPWVGASNLVFVTIGGGDAANYTKTQYSIPASKSTGLKPDSDGVIITARCGEVNGTPVGGLELTSGTHYVRVFFDGSGNIDIGYHAVTTGTLTTVDNAVASATADKWYSFQVEFYSSTAIVRIYNETGGQLGSTETLSTYLTWSSFSNMTLWANTTAANTRILGYDYVYATRRQSNTDYGTTEILPKTKDSAPTSSDKDRIKFSYSLAGIENDTGSQEARNVYNLTQSKPGDFDSQRSYNATEFREALSTVEEYDYDVEDRQTLYLKGWTDLQAELEESLKERLAKISGTNAYVVDYVILDMNCTTVYSDSYVDYVEDWYKKEGVDLILETDPDATVERKDGTVESIATVPRAELGYYLCYAGNPGLAGWNPTTWKNPLGGSKSRVEDVVFSSPEKAQDAFIEVSEAFRGKVSASAGIVKGTVTDFVDSSSNIVGQVSGKVNDMVDQYAVAPTTGIGAKISAGFASMKAKLAQITNSYRDAIEGATSSIATSIRGLAKNLPTAISTSIGDTFEGIKSTFTSAGKALKEKGLSVFNFVGDIASKVKTFLVYGLIFVAIIALVFVAFKAGLFNAYVNKADSE